MKNFKLGWLAAAVAAAVLAACGGGGDGDQTPRVKYGKLVSFGDSLSDVGSYSVGGVAALGGGKYTINGSGAKIWVELLAAQAGVSAPCAAQTGLVGTNTALLSSYLGFSFTAPAPSNQASCYDYAQGGARVTNPVGPGNAALGAQGALGQMTVPVTTQIDNHIAAHGSFASDDLVTVLAGGNDLFIDVAIMQATVAAMVQAGSDVTTATNTAAAAAVQAMATAGTELAGYVNTKVLAHGAKRVVVVNLPDVSLTPYAIASGANAQALVLQMTTAFNTALAAGLAAIPNSSDAVLLVDAFTQSQDQAAAPAQYGLTNVKDPACNLSSTTNVLAVLPTALVCTTGTLITGDTSGYQYADSVHPTPYGYKLLAQFVTDRMIKKGWL